MDNLKPCPFCGGEPILYSGELYEVLCHECWRAGTLPCDTEAEAIEAWNTRDCDECERGAIPATEENMREHGWVMERTCHMTDTQWDNGSCTWGCICSECDAHLEHERGKYLNYCPNCGAKVVN